jgi:hypothetical protein
MKQYLSPLLLAVLITACSEDGAMVATDPSATSESSVEIAAAKKFADGPATFEVTIVNMSHSQPFSPGIVVTHDSSVDLFSNGSVASESIRLIAENGDPSTAFAALNGAPGVTDVVATGAPVFRKGTENPTSLTTEITGTPGDYVSLAVMLICTNDGFVGLDAAMLPEGPNTAVFFPGAYDAGTEQNDESSESLVDACGAIGPLPLPADGNIRPATSEVIAMHSGIAGSADLGSEAHNWRNKVARVSVKRID